MSEEFDFIIVGAGSAGCVAARRIIDRTDATVLLIEAGGTDNLSFVRMPAAVPKAIATQTWAYETDADAATGNRRMTVAQGRILGGSSSVNGMIYIRGQQQDFDDWRDVHGCAGWGFDELLPYFKRAESNESLADDYHGTEGPLPVSENRYRHPLSMAFVRAGQESGLRYTNDFNGSSQEGVGWYQTTIRNGERASTSQTYLKPVAGNDRLRVVTGALVHRIVITGSMATGVEYEVGGQTRSATSRREVILAAGAIGSPKVLLMSGVGPREELARHGITQHADLPVGRNYHDHLHLSVNAATPAANTLDGQERGLKALKNGLQWFAFRSGLVTSNILEAGAFIDTTGEGRPDVQIHFLPLLDRWDDPDGITNGHPHGITLKVGHLRPKGRGEVTLASADPKAMVRIKGGHLSHPDDLAGQIRAAKAALRVANAPSLRSMTSGVFSPVSHGINADGSARFDEAELEAWVRRTCKTVYHPVGTCRMGTDPATSVVDLSMRVHGVGRLRVIDGSTFPAVTSGNTNAPVIAVAEKAVDLILGNH